MLVKCTLIELNDNIVILFDKYLTNFETLR